jgi:hypothetical protein
MNVLIFFPSVNPTNFGNFQMSQNWKKQIFGHKRNTNTKMQLNKEKESHIARVVQITFFGD